MTNSSLSNRSLCEKNSSESGRVSNADKLEQACWNGMLDDFLPGLIVKVEGKTLFLWEIQNAKNFLHINLCEQPEAIDKQYSIDPYMFIDTVSNN